MISLPFRCSLGALCAALLFSAPAWAKPRITVSITQAKQVVVKKGGAQAVRMVPTQDVSSGDTIEYTLHYANVGDEPATDANIEDPIPKGTTYVASSASGEGAEITFSSDGGKTFAPAVKLTYEIRLPNGQVEKRVATPAEYTHVRWTLERVPAGATGTVTFRVKVN